MEAYSTAVQAGISPVEFWRLTPYLARTAARAATEARNTASWLTACLIRAKKMPKLSELIGRREPVSSVENRLKTALQVNKIKKKV